MAAHSDRHANVSLLRNSELDGARGNRFPIALILAWAFELTPEGIKRTEAEDEAATHASRIVPGFTSSS
jgi:hypothetical protein